MRIPAIKVNQWLDEWDRYHYSEDDRQRKPQPYFYVTALPASILRNLCNVPRRGVSTETGRQRAAGPRSEDIGIQRGFQEDRAASIKSFVKAGYPWATLRRSEQARFAELKKPGWLPTSIILNLVAESTVRGGASPHADDVVRIDETGPNTADLIFPDGAEKPDWELKGHIRPFEVIDGQHRLLSFDSEPNAGGQFDLPVVVFDNLDISWQAYLFWTVNITPKRIGPSLAYDLYPLLRTEKWLDPVPGPLAYRENRAQELTEALWSHPDSPWYQRIGMLGRERGLVTQAAFVRSLTVSYIRSWEQGRGRPGGLFGTPLRDNNERLLPWSRSQQAGYLIFLWLELEKAIAETDSEWAKDLRQHVDPRQPTVPDSKDAAFAGEYSLLSTDQGVRGFLQVSNDVSFDLVDEIGIASWLLPREGAATEIEDVRSVVEELRSDPESSDFASRLCSEVAKFDWRTQATPRLSEDVRTRQALYRSGTGYREVRRQLLLHLEHQDDSLIRTSATRLIDALNFRPIST